MRIICSALKVKMHKDAIEKYPNITNDVFILPCCRHQYGYEFLKDVIGVNRLDFDTEEGFLTSKNTFLSRKESYDLIKDDLPVEIQNLKNVRKSKILYSEDLY